MSASKDHVATKPARDARGRLLPGHTANPKGRPNGARDRRSAVYREQIEAAMPELIETVLNKAREGDMTAARILFDRVLPPLKAVNMPLPVPVHGASTAERVEAIIKGVTDGQVAVADAVALIQALAMASRLGGDESPEPVFNVILSGKDAQGDG